MPKELIPRNTAKTLSVSIYVEGVPTNATGDVTYAITNAAGTAVASGTATSLSTGVYTATLAPQSALGLLTVTWTGTVAGSTRTERTHAEVVGNLLATPQEIRTLDGMGDASKFTDAKVQLALNQAQEHFERYLGFSLVERAGLATLDGNGSDTIYLSAKRVLSLTSATVGGTAVGDISGWLTYENGTVVADGSLAYGVRNVVLEFTHGLSVLPLDLHYAYTQYVRYLLLEARNRISDRATSVDDGTVTYSINQPGRWRPTGLPSIDEVLNAYRASPRVVAW